MGLDFFGVTLNASIQVFSGDTKDGEVGVAGIPFTGADGAGLTYDLWTKAQDHAMVPPALKDLAYVQEISVELGMGLNSKVSLVLAPPFEEGLVLLNSPLIQWGVGRLNVSFGYSTGSDAQLQSFTFGGVLQKPDVKIGNDIVITLNALGIGYALKLAEGSVAEAFLATDTPADAVKKVLQAYKGIQIDNIYDEFPASDQNPKTGHPFFKPVVQDGPEGQEDRSLERGPRNDWWFVWELVRAYGLELLIIDNTFIVKHSERWRGEGLIAKRFRLRAGVDPTPQKGAPILPILSISSPTEAVWIASDVGRIVMKDIADDGQDRIAVVTAAKHKAEVLNKLAVEAKREEQQGRSSKKQNEQARKFVAEQAEQNRAAKENFVWGTTKDNRFRFGPLHAAGNAPGNPETSLFAHAKGMLNRHAHMRGIHVDVQTIGIPDLRPGDLVKIDGFAAGPYKEGIFDGVYGVTEVKHQVGLGGFTTIFKAISDFYPRAFQLALQAAGTIPKDDEDPLFGAQQPDRISKSSLDSARDFERLFPGDGEGGSEF